MVILLHDQVAEETTPGEKDPEDSEECEGGVEEVKISKKASDDACIGERHHFRRLFQAIAGVDQVLSHESDPDHTHKGQNIKHRDFLKIDRGRFMAHRE